MHNVGDDPVWFERDKKITSEAIDSINKDFRLIGASPINKDKVSHKLYSVAKIENISKALSENIFHTSFDVSDPSVVEEDGNNII